MFLHQIMNEMQKKMFNTNKKTPIPLPPEKNSYSSW